MKPYNKAQLIPLPRALDRRVKITETDREDIKRRHAEGASIHSISRDMKISRRMIQFILFPERLAVNSANFKKRGQARKSYERERGEKWNARQREIKNRKARLAGVKQRNLCPR